MKCKRMMEHVHAGLSTEDSVSYIIDDYIVSSIRDTYGDSYKAVFGYESKRNKQTTREKVLNVLRNLATSVLALLTQALYLKLTGSLRGLCVLEMMLFVLTFFLLYQGVNQMRRKNPRILRNHGAEHKVYNAANKVGRIPTHAEAKKSLRFCPWCGIKVYSISLTFIFINIILTMNGFFAIPLQLIYTLSFILPGCDPIGFVMQMFGTTAEPTDEELSLALRAYAAAYEISEGRQPNEDEQPSVEKSYEFLEQLDEKMGPYDRLSSDDIIQLEKLRDRVRIENQILETVFGTLIRWWKKVILKAWWRTIVCHFFIAIYVRAW